MSGDHKGEQANKDRVGAAFDAWAAGTGGPFDLLADDATWTIVGNSPVSRTYGSKAEVDANARMSEPLVPSVRHLFADGDWTIVLFDAQATRRDGAPYRNTYTWYLRFGPDGAVVEVIAFFDTIEFTDLWQRVDPA